MTRSLQLLQIIFGRRALLLGVPSAFAGLLAVLILVPTSASAISLSVKLDTHLPLVAPLEAAAEVSLLDAPSRTVAGISAGITTPAGTVAPPAARVPTPANPPVAKSPTPHQPPPSQVEPTPATAVAVPAASGPAEAAAATGQPVATTAEQRQTPEVAIPEPFDFMPKTFSGDNKDFTIALIIITALATLFLGFATYSTTRLARGSPQA